MRRLLRALGTVLVVAGLGTLAWTALVWQWKDPFTSIYTAYEQHELAGRLQARLDHWQGVGGNADHLRSDDRPARAESARKALAGERRRIASEASAYRGSLKRGDPVGRLAIRRLGLSMVVVDGTDHDSLTKGPGLYVGDYVPGEGGLVYIAGHRTTYGAPFAHIDALRTGDVVTLELPYATFVYEVTRHVIVAADDLSVLRSRHREVLALQACHPRFFASHRYIVYARLRAVDPRQGPAYAISADGRPTRWAGHAAGAGTAAPDPSEARSSRRRSVMRVRET